MCEIHSIGPRTRERIVGRLGVPALAGFGIHLTGISEAREGFEWQRMNPADTQYLMTVGGSGEVLLGQEWKRVGAGTVYLTPAGVPHAYRAVRGRSWTVCWVIFFGRPGSLAAYLPDRPALLSIGSRQLWHAIGGACDAAAHHAPRGSMEAWAGLIYGSVFGALKGGGEAHRLDFLWSAVMADLARPWTLEELAKIAGMSKENLRRVCRQELDRSPMRHLARLRFQRAGELLSHGGNKIASVAERVGYPDPFAFSVAFKREMGVPPSGYRQSRFNNSVAVYSRGV